MYRVTLGACNKKLYCRSVPFQGCNVYRLRAGEAVLIREVSLSLRNVLTEWFQYSYGEMYHDPATHMYARTHVHTHACKHVSHTCIQK